MESLQQSESSTETVKHYLVLDTCILQYLGNKDIGGEVKKYIEELASRGFETAISEITITELLRDLNSIQKKEALQVIQLFTRFLVDAETLVGAAQLSTIYKQKVFREIKPLILNSDRVSISDLIIAATAILNKAIILTADVNDFINPVFFPVEEKMLEYRKKDKKNYLYLQLLQPNFSMVRFFMDKRT